MNPDPRRQSRIAAGPAAVGFLLATLAFAGCAPAPAPRSAAPPPAGRTETGMASYYDSEFEGRRTASGERYRGEAMTAAHRTLPFGTWLKVTNLANGRDVELRVNDRGPHRKGRILDVSRAAARELRMIGPGVVRVRVVVIPGPPSEGATPGTH